jgi:hypothetical protein
MADGTKGIARALKDVYQLREQQDPIYQQIDLLHSELKMKRAQPIGSNLNQS